jgi:hypothetical protein
VMESAVSDLRYLVSEFGRELVYLLLGLALVIWLTARSGTALKVIGVVMLLASPAVGFGTTRTAALPRLEPDVEKAVLLAIMGLLLISFGSLVTSASALVAEIRALRNDQKAVRYTTVTSDHREPGARQPTPAGRPGAASRQPQMPQRREAPR